MIIKINCGVAHDKIIYITLHNFSLVEMTFFSTIYSFGKVNDQIQSNFFSCRFFTHSKS